MDVNTGEHYAIYSDRIQKMSITPKLYLAWGYRQLLQTIQSDALRFAVNSPQPSTSGVSPRVPTMSRQTQPSPVDQYTQPPASPCRPTIIKYEPPAFSLEQPMQMLTRDEQNQVLQNHVAAANAVFNKVAVAKRLIQQEPHNTMYYEEVQRVQKNQHIHVAIKLQHILETDDKFRRSAGLPRLDLPEHLWGVRDMRSTHSREQDFMAITAEGEVLCQQLKGKGMYTVPPAFPTTSDSKLSNNVHFQPIDSAQKSSVQTMDQSLLNSSLNLLDDLPRPQSSSSNGQIPCGQTTPQGSAHASNGHVPPTPYVNQTAVNQHLGTQPTWIPPRMSTRPTNLQPPTITPPSRVPSDIQPQQLPFVDAPPAPTQDYSADNTDLPSTRDFRSKSANRQGVKQTSSASSSTSMSMGKSGPICWNCGEAGHLKRNCPNPPYCSKCKQKGHLPMKFPLKGKRNETSQMPQKAQQMSVDQRFFSIRNKCIHCGGDQAPGACPMRTQPQATPSTAGYTVYNGSTGAGKTNNNASLFFSFKNGQSAAASMTLISLVNNSAGTQGHASCTQEPWITPQVSTNTSQQNSYNTPPMQPSNQFPPPPYFPIPFPSPPIAPSNVSNTHSSPVSDISAVITLMTNAVTQGNSNTMAIMNALERMTTQFADAL